MDFTFSASEYATNISASHFMHRLIVPTSAPGRPEVTLCGSRDVNIQELTNFPRKQHIARPPPPPQSKATRHLPFLLYYIRHTRSPATCQYGDRLRHTTLVYPSFFSQFLPRKYPRLEPFLFSLNDVHSGIQAQLLSLSLSLSLSLFFRVFLFVCFFVCLFVLSGCPFIYFFFFGCK